MTIEVPPPARVWRARRGKAQRGRRCYAVDILRPSLRNKLWWFDTPEAALLAYALKRKG